MIEVIGFPSVFQTWDRTEAIIRKHLDNQVPKEEEEDVLSRFKQIYDRLPSQVGEICLPLEGLEDLPARDVDMVYSAVGSAMDQIQDELQDFAGQVLGEIFSLVMELSKKEAKSSHSAVA